MFLINLLNPLSTCFTFDISLRFFDFKPSLYLGTRDSMTARRSYGQGEDHKSRLESS